MGSRERRPLFRYCEPAFFGGLLDDPILFLRIRPERQALLFDCGQIAHLAKRVIKPIRAVFITHAHMDHIMGLPTLVRHHHASPLPVDVYGPSGIADRVLHLLNGFDWNLCEPSWFTLRVHEIHPDRVRHFSFSGPDCFERRFEGEEARIDKVIWSSRYATVEAEILDHKLPVLAFRVTERPHFSVDAHLLEERGILPGKWIRDLKIQVWQDIDRASIGVGQREGEGGMAQVTGDAGMLYAAIRGEQQAASVGYVTDVGWTPENAQKMQELFSGATLLCAECAFLAEDEEKARASYHLCSSDLNDLLHRITPRLVLPMHLSKSYLRRTGDLYRELYPPACTSVLRLPNHLVPPPLTVEDVKGWLRP